MSSLSTKELQKRRQQLRHRRRILFWQAIARTLCVSGAAGSLFWSMSLSDWAIRQDWQIEIKGNHFLKESAIRALIPLSYPQSLLQLPPQRLVGKLESTAHISQARVSREIFPASLIIEIQERQPVAIAASATREVGLLDERGIWMPLGSYVEAKKDFKMPTLKVTGWQDKYLSDWMELYRAIDRSPIKIFEVNLHDPANLVLKTELGNVRFGPYTSKFSEQLTVLQRMGDLPKHVAANKIIYIDLNNLQSPTIKVIEDKTQP